MKAPAWLVCLWLNVFVVTKRRPTEEINVNNKKNKTVSRFYDHLCSVVDHCHRNQTWFGGRPEGNDNGNYPVIAKNLSQHQIHCFCVCVCVCIFVYVCVCEEEEVLREARRKKAWELFIVGLYRRWERGWRQKYKKKTAAAGSTDITLTVTAE